MTSVELLDCLKREEEIPLKPMFSGGKTTLRCTPALNLLKKTSVRKYIARLVW